MKVICGIDLGSTTTKAVLLDEQGDIVGRGITNSRSDYNVACAVAMQEALASTRFSLVRRALAELTGVSDEIPDALHEAYRLELHLDQLEALADEIRRWIDKPHNARHKDRLGPAADAVLKSMLDSAPSLFGVGTRRRSDFFRDLAAEAFMSTAEDVAADRSVPYERLVGLFDRAIIEVETELVERDFGALMTRAAKHLNELSTPARDAVARVAADEVDPVAFVGTGYGRQTLPFPDEAVRSEILCHGRGAHRVFEGTRTVLDIGGQDTKAIQVDENGVVTSFQMNDRCAAGCGRYLGYIADELGLGVHELGPLALRARKVVKVNSTCTVFAGAELRERLALGQRREDILAGLHHAILLRAMSLLARSGGIDDEFTFTGGVCKNPMATKLLAELVGEHYDESITLNIHPDSIFMGALGAALFGLDAVRAGRPAVLPGFARAAA